MPTILEERPTAGVPQLPTDDDRALRERATKQIERRRRFWLDLVVSGIGMTLLVLVWAMSEYHSAGGWPTQGFSQSSGIHDVWNLWIVYPLVAWVLYVGARAYAVFIRKPISESEIRREMERQARV